MLVLSRQRDETIMIGDDIEVTVVDIRGDKVRLGINAPKNVTVHRKEVYEAIRRENREAAQVKPEDLPGMKLTPPSNNQGTNPSSPTGASPTGSKFPKERIQGTAATNAANGGGEVKPSDGSAGTTAGPGGNPG